MQKAKSATTAGIFGVALGSFGVHNFYLGRRVYLGFIHIGLFVLSFILILIAAIIDANTILSLARLLGRPSVAMVLCYIFGFVIYIGNAIWGAVEGFILLSKGDRALPAQPAPAVVPAAPITGDAASASAPAAASPAPAAAPAPVPAAPKQPMDPAKKKKLITGLCIGAGALVAVIVGIIVLVLALRVDYGESYRAAKELDEYVSELYSDYDCKNALRYYDSSYTSEKTYNNYISECKDLLSSETDLVSKLEKTSAVRKDSQIKGHFDKFKTAYASALPDAADAAAKLEIYQAWHTFRARKSDTYISRSTEKDYRNVASALTNSGNDDLKEYGEKWLELVLAYRTAYKNYWDNSSAGSAESKALTAARNAYNDYENDEEPDIEELAPLDFDGIDKMYSEFQKLYSEIKDAYEEHYDDSGDCRKTSTAVYCD